jgi:hypothetical protein
MCDEDEMALQWEVGDPWAYGLDLFSRPTAVMVARFVVGT